jgi:hypothetical protein
VPVTPGLIVAAVITVVLLVGGGVAALLLGGTDEPGPAGEATASSPPADLRGQVLALDALMKQLRAARGDSGAAIADRSAVLDELGRLRGQAGDAKLKAGLGSLIAATRESLRQHRTCGDACPAGEDAKLNRLKRRALRTLNPLLRRYATTTYRRRDL